MTNFFSLLVSLQAAPIETSRENTRVVKNSTKQKSDQPSGIIEEKLGAVTQTLLKYNIY